MELVPVSLVPTCATKWVHKAVKDYQQWVYCKTTETEKGNKLFPQWWLLSLLLIQLNLWSQNVSRPWRELQRRYKSELRSTKHESPHRTIEAPRTPRSWGGGQISSPTPFDFSRVKSTFWAKFDFSRLNPTISKKLTSAGWSKSYFFKCWLRPAEVKKIPPKFNPFFSIFCVSTSTGWSRLQPAKVVQGRSKPELENLEPRTQDLTRFWKPILFQAEPRKMMWQFDEIVAFVPSSRKIVTFLEVLKTKIWNLAASHRTWNVTKCDGNVTSYHFVTVPDSNPGPGSREIPAWSDPQPGWVLAFFLTWADVQKKGGKCVFEEIPYTLWRTESGAGRIKNLRLQRAPNAAFKPPRTIKILVEGRPRGPRRVYADAHIETQRGNQWFRITQPDYWRSETTWHR